MSAAKRGYGRRWQRYRLSYLKANPLCVKCIEQTKAIAAEVVDHIIPHKGDHDLFWDKNNHQPLCTPCHNYKTATEDGGFGR